MKKYIALIFVIVTILFVLCGCIPQPFVEQTFVTTDKPSAQMRAIYVSGAVLSDGYVDVPVVCDYKTLLEIVGVTSYSAVPEDANRLLSKDLDVYIVDFVNDEVVYASVNVNSIYVVNRLGVDGVSMDIVNKLASYIEANGVITNRLQMKSALGDDYDDNYYKFYIDVVDYA